MKTKKVTYYDTEGDNVVKRTAEIPEELTPCTFCGNPAPGYYEIRCDDWKKYNLSFPPIEGKTVSLTQPMCVVCIFAWENEAIPVGIVARALGEIPIDHEWTAPIISQ